MKEKCPCEGCIIVSFCRNKYFIDFRYCKELSKFLGFVWENKSDKPNDSKKHFKNYPKFYKTLKPTKWSFEKWPRGHERRKIDYAVIHVNKPPTK